MTSSTGYYYSSASPVASGARQGFAGQYMYGMKAAQIGQESAARADEQRLCGGGPDGTSVLTRALLYGTGERRPYGKKSKRAKRSPKKLQQSPKVSSEEIERAVAELARELSRSVAPFGPSRLASAASRLSRDTDCKSGDCGDVATASCSSRDSVVSRAGCGLRLHGGMRDRAVGGLDAATEAFLRQRMNGNGFN